MIGTIRLVEAKTISVKGPGLEEIHASIVEQTPTGWELVSAPVTMSKSDTDLRCEATIVRRAETTTIEAPDLAGLKAILPKGYQLLCVR